MDNSFQNSTIAQIIEAIIEQLSFEGESKSDIADILLSILNQTTYDKEPRSVIAELFIMLKSKIEGEPFDPFDKSYTSRISEILLSIINETEYNEDPQSRIAELLLELKAELESYTEVTVSGSIASFNTNVAKPLVSLKAGFVANQESGTPTPSTPKAINGVSSIKVTHCGKNLFNGTNVINAYLSGAGVVASFDKTRSVYIPCKSNTTYVVSKQAGARFAVAYCDSLPKNNLQTKGMTIQNTASSITITTDSTARYLVAYIYHSDYDSVTSETMISSVQIELGSTATSYEAYNGESITIALGGTYYGGYIQKDNSGSKLVLTWKKFNLSELTSDNWSYYSDLWLSESLQPVIKKVVNNNEIGNIKSNAYTTSSRNNVKNSDYQIAINTNGTIYIYSNSYVGMTKEQFISAISDFYIIYELAEPIELPLTDIPDIITFNGVNNIFSDGDTEVTYLYKGEPPLSAPLSFGLGLNSLSLDQPDIISDIEQADIIEEE